MKQSLPRHLAIIMDGNGRWATERRFRRISGHRAGVRMAKRIVHYCRQLGLEVLTLFAFSLENRGRPLLEVRFLMRLMSSALQKELTELHENGIRLRVIGDRSCLDHVVQKQIDAAEQLTCNNTGMTLVISLYYSGRWDIIQAVQRLMAGHTGLGAPAVPISLEFVEQAFRAQLSLGELPDPDLIIRTGGERRISNFMLWHIAYSELFFSDEYWPDFDESALDRALRSYQDRQRRFGVLPDSWKTHCA